MEFEASTRMQDTSVSFGYQLDVPKANLQFKGGFTIIYINFVAVGFYSEIDNIVVLLQAITYVVKCKCVCDIYQNSFVPTAFITETFKIVIKFLQHTAQEEEGVNTCWCDHVQIFHIFFFPLSSLHWMCLILCLRLFQAQSTATG